MKILIADDHSLMIEAIKAKLLELGQDIEFVAAMSAEQMFAAVCADLDLAMVDLSMPGTSGYQHIAELRRRFPALPLIVLSGTEDPQVIRDLIDLGVLGFIPKSYSGEVMLLAVRLVLAGGVYIPPMLLGAVSSASQAVPAGMPAKDARPAEISVEVLQGLLTERQMEVLRLLSLGKSNKLIAQELAISAGTVKIHLAAIFRALNVRNRTEAVVAAHALTEF
jgi:DNA-binding NarL/FixJ family response regulator